MSDVCLVIQLSLLSPAAAAVNDSCATALVSVHGAQAQQSVKQQADLGAVKLSQLQTSTAHNWIVGFPQNS